jgi:hypothetical protein
MSRISEQLKERRLARMRLGQAAWEPVNLISDPEQRFALVPLTEAEYEDAMTLAASAFVPENIAGAALRDRIEQTGVVLKAVRNFKDHTELIFDDIDDLIEALEPQDINHIYDTYVEMTSTVTPMDEGVDGEGLEEVKKVLVEMSLSELSGAQWYALKRFLSTISPEQLLDRFSGSSSTSLLTETKSEEESTSNV